MQVRLFLLTLVFILSACTEIEPKPFVPSEGHIQADKSMPAPKAEIPDLVQNTPPLLPEPEPVAEQEKYTVVVNEVPVKELLFALARDAKVNVDIDPSINGVVTINAVDQTLPQILDRIARQVAMRYEIKANNIIIQPDAPYLQTYKINYVNIARETESEVTIATQIASTSGGGAQGAGGGGGGGGNNNSTTAVKSKSNNRFWETLVANVTAILAEEGTTLSTSSGGEGVTSTANVIPSPESGLLTVKATAKQHEKIRQLIDNMLHNANRQVLIQATILEVSLNDQYQAGINWSYLNEAAGIGIASATGALTGPVGTITSLLLSYSGDKFAKQDSLNLTINLLDEFGDVRVLSSPQLMVLNNQTALLKVVDNFVYFTVESQTTTNQINTLTNFTTTVNTVPVGIVMTVTPQINDNQSVLLNVRPSISRISDFADDPTPGLAVVNQVPVIQVREMDSLLRMQNGQIAVLGGLMQDETRDNNNSIPGAKLLPGIGKAFETNSKEYFKTELVIFLRPVIVNNPSIETDLNEFKDYLQQTQYTPPTGSGEANP